MPALHSFDYAIVRVVPRVERDEFVNAGVILFCRTLDFLEARIELDRRRLAALASDVDPAEVERYLASIPVVCAGGEAAGPLGKLSPSERFNWLVAPSSSLIQTSPVHAGLCADPRAALEHLLETAVRLPPAGPAESEPGRGRVRGR
ncbi:MAG: DUF3037 domain-containing protein [Chloroflexota bacterium]